MGKMKGGHRRRLDLSFRATVLVLPRTSASHTVAYGRIRVRNLLGRVGHQAMVVHAHDCKPQLTLSQRVEVVSWFLIYSRVWLVLILNFLERLFPYQWKVFTGGWRIVYWGGFRSLEPWTLDTVPATSQTRVLALMAILVCRGSCKLDARVL